MLLCAVLTSCAGTAPSKKLVDVRKVIPGISIDLRYATADNVTGRALYPKNMRCLLRPSTAEKLKTAQTLLKSQGYGLRIWDAWRPMEAHEILFNHGIETGLFLDPSKGWSRHCGGVSVDATLVDRQGREQRMPSDFDEAPPHASNGQLVPDPMARHNLRILHEAMTAAGFQALPGEWWHFDDLEFLYQPIPVILSGDVGVRIEQRGRS